MKRIALVLGVAILAGPASAQMTTCSSTTNYVNCYTFPPAPSMQPPPPSYTPAPTYTAPDMSGFASLFARLHERRERRAAEERDRISTSLRFDVISMVKAGRCDVAESRALDGGDMQLAAQVHDYCRPAPPQAPVVVYPVTPQ